MATKRIYDLLLKGGRVVDPAANRDGTFDVAVKGDKIVAVKAGIPKGTAKKTIDVSGRIVIPGMIDTHAHVFQYVTGRFGLNADQVGVHSGVTAVVDAGGSGWTMFPAFKKFIAEPAQTRVYLFISPYVIGAIEGNYYPDLYGPDCIDVERTVHCAQVNADIIKGVKIHAEVGGMARFGLDMFKAAVEIGRKVDIPLYIHFGQLWPQPHEKSEYFKYRHKRNGKRVDPDSVMRRVLKLLKPGDILAHPFSMHPGSFVNSKGRVHPLIREALAKGARVDVGHGAHFRFDNARKVLDAGIMPFTLGADMHGYNMVGELVPGMPDWHPDEELRTYDQGVTMTHGMNEFLALGVDLNDVVAMVTANCAINLKLEGKIGTLRPRVVADVTVLADERGRWRLSDTGGTSVTTGRLLRPLFCLRAGEVVEADSSFLEQAKVAVKGAAKAA